jgi:hypothetical protein
MENDSLMLSLIVNAAAVSLPKGLAEDQLYSHFQSAIIVELLQQDAAVINHFGLVPDNAADGIDDALFNGILFRFDVPQAILGIDLDAKPNEVRAAFLSIIENFIPSSNMVLEERGETKIETTLVFEYYHL